jgi:hypothetical protein
MTTIPKPSRISAASYHATSAQDMSTSSDDESVVEISSNLENDDCLCFARHQEQTSIVINPPDGHVLFQQPVEEYASNGSLENVQETAQQVICEFQNRLLEKLPRVAIAALLPPNDDDVLRLEEHVVVNALQQAVHKNKRRSTRAKLSTKRLVDENFAKPRVRASSRRAITRDTESNHDSSSSQDHPASSHKAQDENSNLVYDLHDEDVISTNGGSHVLPHPGNVRFVHMSVAYGKRYHKARSEQGRFAVVQDFIQAFQGRRFVKHLGRGVYRKLPHGSVIQKVTRALKRAITSPKAIRNEADNSSKAHSVPMPKRTRCKRPVKNEQVKLLPTSKEARRPSETRLGRKRRRVSRFLQDEHHEEASVAPTTRVVKTAADIVVGPTPAKRTSSSRVQDVPPKTASVATSLRSPPAVPNRVSPDAVPTTTTACKPLVVLSSRGIPIVLPNTPTTAMPVVLGVNGNPHGLGLLAQRFTNWVRATKNFDCIDLDVAVRALKIPKRRIYDIVNILEGAGVLQRKSGRKNVFFWAAPSLEDHTQEMQHQALEQQQDEQLDKWMEMLQRRQMDIMEESNISGSELAPLLGLETTLLAVHVPQHSFLRTIHTMPVDNNDAGPIAFKITSHGEPKDFPKACLLTHGETKLRPVEVNTSLSPSKAAFGPHARYPAQSPAIECHDPNPLGTLLKVLPKPPPKAGLSYTDFSPGFQPMEVSDDDEERDASPFVSLWRQDDKEQSHSPFEALLKASEAVCE